MYPIVFVVVLIFSLDSVAYGVKAYTRRLQDGTPTPSPTPFPTLSPTQASTKTDVPSIPTEKPSIQPTPLPTLIPTAIPTVVSTHTDVPSIPTEKPTVQPTPLPTVIPTPIPTPRPSPVPTVANTKNTDVPTIPTEKPTVPPTPFPTPMPSKTDVPSIPTERPSFKPTHSSVDYGALPSSFPSSFPSSNPTHLKDIEDEKTSSGNSSFENVMYLVYVVVIAGLAFFTVSYYLKIFGCPKFSFGGSSTRPTTTHETELGPMTRMRIA